MAYEAAPDAASSSKALLASCGMVLPRFLCVFGSFGFSQDEQLAARPEAALDGIGLVGLSDFG